MRTNMRESSLAMLRYASRFTRGRGTVQHVVTAHGLLAVIPKSVSISLQALQLVREV